ncbi:MAG: AlpA family phage regulatory protein [Burkholderiales bacterium]|nr:AlpA family phage regulatory protein [Burkholderiales bacterium]
MQMMVRLRGVLERTGDGRSTLYNKIRDSLFVPPVPIGARAVAWPSSEIDTIIAARIAGRSDDEIKALVQRLVAARKHAYQAEVA